MRPLDELWELVRWTALAYAGSLVIVLGLYAIVCALGGGCRWP